MNPKLESVDMTLRNLLLAAISLAGFSADVRAQTFANVEYANVGGQSLRLDLYLPTASAPVPVVLWIHGGGWCAGGRAPLAAYAAPLPASGIAVAAVSYRLTSTTPNCANSAGAIWPAQIHDVKGAVRWLRANASSYNLDPTRVAVWGQSAGAHLASTLALSAGDAALEGTVGGNLTQSSAVSALVAYYPPTDLLQLGPDFALTPPNLPGLVATVDGPAAGHAVLVGFGGPGEGIGLIRANATNPNPPWPTLYARALSAGPVNWASPGDPPVYLLHGTNDTTVPLNQSRRLRDALLAANVTTVYREIAGLSHVPPADSESQMARDWLRARLTERVFSNGFETPPPGINLR